QAINQAKKQGIDLTGSTAYVTLEPCSHQGKTGPCANALIPTGVKKVVGGTLDPNPLVAGRGVRILQDAGIEVKTGVLEAECRWLNRGFFMRMENRRPWVRLKVASSADGVTALNNGVSQWITGEQARAHGHSLRAQACAVLTGFGTVRADNPQLNVRGIQTPRQPIKVVVDSRLDIAASARLLETGRVWLVHANQEEPAWLSEHSNRQHIELINAHSAQSDTNQGKTDLNLLLRILAQKEIQELHLEAGFGLNGSFLQAGLVDEIVHYVAPKFLGPGQGLFRLPELSSLPESEWTVRDTKILGDDVQITWVKKQAAGSA
ncbi:MAG: bifunctional diaminohydroxyphosphoribosylaminopyrimidine deaminase/5-amino-6-(5-phosphoribosylamino)uracil reductase RibD, partial [Limnobacter sp.]|nr:bifunctional diaminohydroxyphosphoribosylaminopyrimidine deaminase/5-amino-6-(5-phosphoribosylamino)uracil reductase RibD [Limnobacter sp.]